MPRLFITLSIFGLLQSCGTGQKSRKNSPPDEKTSTSSSCEDLLAQEGGTTCPESAEEPPKTSESKDPFGDLLKHAKSEGGAIISVCQIPGDDGACLSYRLVKAYYPNPQDKEAGGPLQKTCEEPAMAPDTTCQLFRLTRGEAP